MPGLLGYFSPSKTALNVQERRQSEETQNAPPENIPLPLSPVPPAEIEEKPAKQPARRFSFRVFTVQSHEEPRHSLSAIQEKEKRDHAAAAFSKRLAKPLSSNSDKRAHQSALLVRGLIMGPTASSPELSSAVAKPQMNKLKSQLMQPKSANKIIAHLRELSVDAGDATPSGPIHAVCLPYSDEEAHKRHFANLDESGPSSIATFAVMNTVSVDALSSMFNEMHIIDLIKSPDLGFGQPGDGYGILAGAVPTAETVINGIEQITPQLMALGYATGRAIIPDHSGIHPPTDRMSVITYWWGLEVLLPPPSLVYLKSAHSVSGAVINFLSAVAMINTGVREILPFIRYISQFIDFEFNTIMSQNKGRGVVCAATWIMPAAMVPRPWDFTPAPPKPVAPPSAPPVDTNIPVSDKPSPEPAPTSPPLVSIPAPSAPEPAPTSPPLVSIPPPSAPQASPITLTPSIPAAPMVTAAPLASAAESAPMESVPLPSPILLQLLPKTK